MDDDADGPAPRPAPLGPVDQLATALAKAQAEIHNAEKSALNPAFKRDGKVLKYATLADVWNACRGPLTKNGLSIVQMPQRSYDGGVVVDTIMLHTSGQTLVSRLEMPVAQGNAHGIGSAISYARRYALSAMVGVAPDDDDDDGNAASDTPSSYSPPAPRTATQSAKPSKAKQEADRVAELRENVRVLYESLGGKAWKPWSEVLSAAGVPRGQSLTLQHLLAIDTYIAAQVGIVEAAASDMIADGIDMVSDPTADQYYEGRE